jgi:hypothetical protein
MQRGGIPDHMKTPTYLYIDEFHNYVTTSIKDVLAEARSNRLYLTLAQQLVGQDISDRNFKRVLMGNTNIKILGKSTQENYKDLAADFGLEMERMQQLPKFYYFVKVGHGVAFRIKGRGGLAGNKNSMHTDQWKEIGQEQVKKYYVPAHDAIKQKRKEEATRATSTSQPATDQPVQPAKKKTKGPNDQPDESTMFSF